MTKSAAVMIGVLLFSLTGCTSTPATAPSEQADAASAAPVETPAATQEPSVEPTPEAPVTPRQVEVSKDPVETPAPVTYASLEEQFVAESNAALTSWGYDALDSETLLAGGAYLCTEMAANVDYREMTAFGDVGAAIYGDIARVAYVTICHP